MNESLEDSGFDVKDAISKIEKDYPKQEKFILKNFPDKAVYENGIDKFALSVLIQTRLYEKNNIKDSHYSLNSGSVKFGLPSNKAYFSDLFFVEDNGSYSVTGNKTVVSSTVTQPNEGSAESKIKIDSKIYILMNNKTASAAEMGVACAYLLGKENIVLIGENSSGCADYADPHTYTLPNSRIEIRLCSTEFKNCSLLKDNQNYFGDSYGFFPDYWTTNDDLDMSLQYLTKDDSVSID